MAMCTNCCLAPTMVLTYLVLHTHILSTILTAHDTLLTQIYDKSTYSDNCLVFLSVRHWKFPVSPLHSSLVLMDLQIHTSLVRSSKYLETLSSAWSACLRSLRASSVFCLISTLFAPNNWLTASTSLRLLPCQFFLHLFLVPFLYCCFCVFFAVSRCQIPVPARWCIITPGSRNGFFLILYSLGRFHMLTVDQYQLPIRSASFWGPPNFNLGQLTEMCPRLAQQQTPAASCSLMIIRPPVTGFMESSIISRNLSAQTASCCPWITLA